MFTAFNGFDKTLEFSEIHVRIVSAIIEHSNQRYITEQLRDYGTLQCSTWNFKQVNARERLKKIFVVVTRHDYPWAENILPEKEAYSLVVNLRDKKNEQAVLLQ